MKKMTKNPLVPLVFRVLVILTAVLAVVALVNFSGAMFCVDEHDYDEAYKQFGTASGVFKVLTVTGILSVVLSFIAKANCKTVSVAVRSVTMIISMIMVFASLKFNAAAGLAAKVYDEFGSLRGVSEDDLEDIGVTLEKLEEAHDVMSDDSVILYLFAMIVAMLVFGILTFTSVHYLLKKKEQA